MSKFSICFFIFFWALRSQAEISAEPTYANVKSLILNSKCLKCHVAGGSAEDLPLDSYDYVILGQTDDGQKFVVPGLPFESAMFKAVNEDPDIRGGLKLMPPRRENQALTPTEIEFLAKWISAGAPQ